MNTHEIKQTLLLLKLKFGGSVQPFTNSAVWTVPISLIQNNTNKAYAYNAFLSLIRTHFSNTQYTVDADHENYIVMITLPTTVTTSPHQHSTVVRLNDFKRYENTQH